MLTLSFCSKFENFEDFFGAGQDGSDYKEEIIEEPSAQPSAADNDCRDAPGLVAQDESGGGYGWWCLC